MKHTIIVSAAAAIMAATGAAHANSVDLSSWVKEGGSSTWNVQGAGNDSVLQTVNGNPAVFVNGVSSQGQQLSGTIKVETTSDDDYIGFVLGYGLGDFANTSADYLLIDWKQGNQGSFGCTAQAGLAISRVTGILANNSGAWCHDPANNVTELQRGIGLGATGWADNVEYSFDLVFQPSLVEVFVDGTKELSVTGSFTDGSFGFYNYSQASVRYAGITQVVAPPPPPQPSAVPVPMALPLMATGLGAIGLLGLRRRRG